MQFGVHVSIAGGIEHAPGRARAVGADIFQIFSRSPRGGPFRASDEAIAAFVASCREHGYAHWYTHAPYYITLASDNPIHFHGSISTLANELEVAERMGTRFVITHLGSAKERPKADGIDGVIKGLCKVAETQPLERLLLEISAGSGNIVGDSLEDLATIMEAVDGAGAGSSVARIIGGVCLDTCHLFAAGYDLRTAAGVDALVAEVQRTIGLERVQCIHLNDSKYEFHAKKDRHALLGKGAIGDKGLQAFVQHKAFRDLDMILETPYESDDDMRSELAHARKLAGATG
ncbi:MAG: putative endonuclease 4 [Parcubacteria group bacterium GW2011_GWA2_47_8]|nr:MAG: putative endonuclease 4 [Parcubacteria group bacterium GW2011_GWA2_47_8]OHB18717.1 MAG: hypothetical protein A2666_02575 [Parcubacteria group bacterium RIFCSPHIGHO2_01_FULL_47_10b]